jgi:hypothetical protein
MLVTTGNNNYAEVSYYDNLKYLLVNVAMRLLMLAHLLLDQTLHHWDLTKEVMF